MTDLPHEEPPLIAITMGDPCGIGPEVLLKFAAEALTQPDRSYQFVAIGETSTLKKTAEQLGISVEFNAMGKFKRNSLVPNRLNILNLDNIKEDQLHMGKVGKESGQASVEFVLKATELAMLGEVDAITTAPISKEAMHLAGHHYPGHTELLAHQTKTSDFAMMMVGGKIRVVLVTTHFPLREVAEHIEKNQIKRVIKLAHRSLSFYEGKNPKIAVAALNPHAGDGGVLGNEEIEEIIPAIEECKKEGIKVSGPYPADSLFVKAKQGEFDAVIVMYHDQGLIPVKMEGFGQGINVTLGLPLIRTSVDHGVAYDIAGKGIADSSSMKAAVHYAAEMARKK